MQGPDRRARVLAELGLVRWRLRDRSAGDAATGAAVGDSGGRVADAQAAVGSTAASGRAGRTSLVSAPVPGSAVQATARTGVRAALRVAAPETRAAPADPVAATVWSQVLAWLGYRSEDVAWFAAGEQDVIVLPPVATWRTPEGKRGLWQALRAHVRVR